jgi:hypothetical protein
MRVDRAADRGIGLDVRRAETTPDGGKGHGVRRRVVIAVGMTVSEAASSVPPWPTKARVSPATSVSVLKMLIPASPERFPRFP